MVPGGCWWEAAPASRNHLSGMLANIYECGSAEVFADDEVVDSSEAVQLTCPHGTHSVHRQAPPQVCWVWYIFLWSENQNSTKVHSNARVEVSMMTVAASVIRHVIIMLDFMITDVLAVVL